MQFYHIKKLKNPIDHFVQEQFMNEMSSVKLYMYQD